MDRPSANSTQAGAPDSATAHHGGAAPRSIELDDLGTMTMGELTDLYRAGTAPVSLAELDGDPLCRVLAVRTLDRGLAAGLVRRWTWSRAFWWAGKSFESTGDLQGAGINRVRLRGERAAFRFETRVEPSAIDGQPCVVLDYDLPDNPRVIRMIRDELREVSPRLFFGPALLHIGGRTSAPMLYFACDNL